jgi:hypothetical protein
MESVLKMKNKLPSTSAFLKGLFGSNKNEPLAILKWPFLFRPQTVKATVM